MEVYVAIVLVLLLVAVAVVALSMTTMRSLIFGYSVAVSQPQGAVAFKTGNTFVIPVKYVPTSNAPPLTVCKVGVVYSDATGVSRAGEAVLVNGAGSFADGTVRADPYAITGPVTGTITIAFNGPGFTPTSVSVFFCEPGSSNPSRSAAVPVNAV